MLSKKSLPIPRACDREVRQRVVGGRNCSAALFQPLQYVDEDTRSPNVKSQAVSKGKILASSSQ